MTTATRSSNYPPDPDGHIGSNLRNRNATTRRRLTWNDLFAGFAALAVTASLLSVLTGTYILPGTYLQHGMDHSERHPHLSFDAAFLRRDNQRHRQEFASGYERHRQAAARRRERRIEHEEEEAQHEEEFFRDVRGENAEAQLVAELSHEDANAKATDGNGEKEEEERQQHQHSDEPLPHESKPQAYHMVFSTSCSPFQNWQALAFFYFARKVRQPGTVTRLVSGCTDDQTSTLQKVHTERVVPMAIEGLQSFHMHVTPNFDDSKGGDQKYFNKPMGLLHWMENSLGFKNGADAAGKHPEDDSIIIIVDPDMMLLRPITKDFSSINYRAGWTNTSNTRKHEQNGDAPVDYRNDVVVHGRPHAQKYGYGSSWLDALKNHTVEVVGENSPVLTMSHDDAGDYYPAGPPYVATAKDMYQIAVHWVKFLPTYHNFFDGMMCEMHSYSLAAAHLRLPHKLAEAFMVSDYESGENFGFVDDKMTLANSCMDPPNLQPAGVPMDPNDSRTSTDPAYEGLGIPIRDLPFVLHYCQRYALGRYFFSKYKLQEDLFDNCEAPLMIEPPRDVAVIYDWNMFPNGVEHWDFVYDENEGQIANYNKPLIHKRNSWLLCAVVFGVNEAIVAYKKTSCGSDPKFFQKTYHFHEDEAFRKSIEDPSNPFVKQKKDLRQQRILMGIDPDAAAKEDALATPSGTLASW